jgi:uncharacterized protein
MHPLSHPLFVQFISHFNGDRDYFECHEVLEDYWKEIDPRNKDHILTAWIQLATSLYHWRRQNFTGAIRTMHKAISKMDSSRHSIFFEGIDYDDLLDCMNSAYHAMKEKKPFSPFKLIIQDNSLKNTLNMTVMDEQYKLTDSYELIHKHMLRDRSHILKEREEKRRNRDY